MERDAERWAVANLWRGLRVVDEQGQVLARHHDRWPWSGSTLPIDDIDGPIRILNDRGEAIDHWIVERPIRVKPRSTVFFVETRVKGSDQCWPC